MTEAVWPTPFPVCECPVPSRRGADGCSSFRCSPHFFGIKETNHWGEGTQVGFASILTGEFQRLNLLCHVFQMRRESVRNLGRIISRLRDIIAHLEEAREHWQYRD